MAVHLRVDQALHTLRRWSLQEQSHPGAISRAMHASSAALMRAAECWVSGDVDPHQYRSIVVPTELGPSSTSGAAHEPSKLLPMACPPGHWWLLEFLWLEEVGRRIDRQIPPAFFAGRLTPAFHRLGLNAAQPFGDGRRRHKHWKTSYRRLVGDLHNAGHAAVVVRTDLTAFFEQIKETPSQIAQLYEMPGNLLEKSAILDRMHSAVDGLPIGLPSSRLLANALLAKTLAPLHKTPIKYTVFVDDIYFVFPLMQDGPDLLAQLRELSQGLLVDVDGETVLRTPHSRFQLSKAKTKTAVITGLDTSAASEEIEADDPSAVPSRKRGRGLSGRTGDLLITATDHAGKPNYDLVEAASDLIQELQLGGPRSTRASKGIYRLLAGMSTIDLWSIRDHWHDLFVLCSFGGTAHLEHLVELLHSIRIEPGSDRSQNARISLARNLLIENAFARGLAGRGADSPLVEAALAVAPDHRRNRFKNCLIRARRESMFDDAHSPLPCARILPFSGDLYSTVSLSAFIANPRSRDFTPDAALAERRGVAVPDFDLNLHTALADFLSGEVRAPDPQLLAVSYEGKSQEDSTRPRVTVLTAQVDHVEAMSQAEDLISALEGCPARRNAIWDGLVAAKEQKAHLLVAPEWFTPLTMLRRSIRYLHQNRIAGILPIAPFIHDRCYFNLVVTSVPRSAKQPSIVHVRAKHHLSPHEIKWLAPLRDRDAPANDAVHHFSTAFGELATLVCFEITDMKMRAACRGKSELIANPCFNYDVEYFDAVYRSSARDLYSFVIAANVGNAQGTLVTQPTNSATTLASSVHGGIGSMSVTTELDLATLRLARSSGIRPPKPASQYSPYFKDLPAAWGAALTTPPPSNI